MLSIDLSNIFLDEQKICQSLIEGKQEIWGLKLGDSLCFPQEKNVKDIQFGLHCITRSEDDFGFLHLDYHLVGECPISEESLHFRLRFTVEDKVDGGYSLQVFLLQLFEERSWDLTFEKKISDHSGEFEITTDENGNSLLNSRKYWRVQDSVEPIEASVNCIQKHTNTLVSLLVSSHVKTKYWDFYRQTFDQDGVSILEYLIIELNKKTHMFSLLRGVNFEVQDISLTT